MKRQFLILVAIALVWTATIAVGCHGGYNPITVAPHNVTSRSASFDGNLKNSGILSANENGFLVTQHFIDRHGIKSNDPGVTAEGTNYRITAELLDRAIAADQKRKNEQK